MYRRIVVAGGLEPPLFPCRRFTVCCRRRWATPPMRRFAVWVTQSPVGPPGIEPGSGLPSTIACRHVRVRRFILIRGRVRSANPHGFVCIIPL